MSYNNIPKKPIKCMLLIMALLLWNSVLQAEVPLTVTCTITSPSSRTVEIKQGESILFSGRVQSTGSYYDYNGGSGNVSPASTVSILPRWSFPGGTPSASTRNTVSVTYNQAGTFTATLRGSDVSGNTCLPVTRRVIVEPPPEPPPTSPTANIINPLEDQAVIVGQAINLTGQGDSENPDFDPSYAWDFGDGRTSTEENPGELSYPVAGTYTVTLTVTDNSIADPAVNSATASVTIRVEQLPDMVGALIPSLSANQLSALSSITESVLSGQASAALQAGYASIEAAAQADDPNIRQAIGRITPDQTQAPSDASLNSVGLQIGNIGARLMALRMGTASGFDLAGLTIDVDGNRISGRQMQGLMEAFANGGAASADDSGFSRLGVFVSGRLSRGTRDATDNVEGFKYRVTGLTAGADYRLQDDLIVGGALGYSRAKTDIRDDGGDVDADNYSATLYGTWYQDSGVFVDGSLTYSRGDFDQQRNVNYTLPTQGVTVDQIFDASFKGHTFGVAVSGGYEFRQDALTLVPFARLQYLRARIDGYQETVRRPGEPGSGFGVEIDKQRFTSFTSALGVQANYAISQPWGVLMPFASVEWVHEFDKSNDNLTGRFLGDRGGNTFSFAVDDTDSNYFDLGVGVAAQFTQGTSGFVNYQRIEGFSNLSHYSVNAGLRFEF